MSDYCENDFIFYEPEDTPVPSAEPKKGQNLSDSTPHSDSNMSPPQKITAFTMYEHFKNHARYANINGIPHLFYQTERCYRPVDQYTLEKYLLETYYQDVAQTGSLRIVKTCAELILRQYVPNQTSADKCMTLCFKTGFIRIEQIEYATFEPYIAADPLTSLVYPTYTINATPPSNIGSWSIMKALPTPKMDDFVYEIAMGNPVIIERIWQMIGYLLTPDMNGKCFFLLQGVPNSGKSVVGNFLGNLFPDYRIASLDIDQLGKRHATSILVDKSINISMDLPNKILSPLAIRNIKLMTGNDDITIEYRNGKLEKYRGNCKFLFATNHPITLNGVDSGFEERIVCIPFYNEITPERRNYNLWQDLLLEKDFIVSKALAYYRDLRLNQYEFSGQELEICKPKIRYLATQAEDQDASLCGFIESRCEFVSQEYGIYTEELYRAYLAYCKELNETPIDNMSAFSRRLLRCYGDQITKRKWRRGDNENRWGFRGIAIQPMRPITMVNGVYNV